MIICDRCNATACDKVTFLMDDQHFDLCASCRQVVLETLTLKPMAKPQPDDDPSEKKRRGGRPRKDG